MTEFYVSKIRRVTETAPEFRLQRVTLLPGDPLKLVEDLSSHIKVIVYEGPRTGHQHILRPSEVRPLHPLEILAMQAE